MTRPTGVVPLGDFIRLNPPESVVTTDGYVIAKVAARITDDHELDPVGFVTTVPPGGVANLVTELIPEVRSRAAFFGHTAVVGTASGSVVFNKFIDSEQPWYRRSAAKQIKKAQRDAGKAVLNHLRLG